MVKYCSNCGEKLSFFSSLKDSVCKECKLQIKKQLEEQEAKLVNERKTIIKDIVKTKSITNEQIETLKNQNKQNLITIYGEICDHFESDDELDKIELELLQKIQLIFNLSNEDVRFEQRVMPYHYVYMIREENKLPTVQLSNDDNINSVILKKGEEVHFATPAILKEVKTINLGYQGGSRGVSLRVMKGVSYRVGSHRGQIKKEEKFVETSRGYLLLTNKRIFLHPAPNYKPVSIPLNKVLSYNCFQNGVEIFKDGRQKGYFFETNNEAAPELIGMSLGFMFEGL